MSLLYWVAVSLATLLLLSVVSLVWLLAIEPSAADVREQAVKRGLAHWVADARGHVRFEWTASVGREPYDDSKEIK